MFFLFALFSDEPEVLLLEYSQTAILHAAYFRRVVNGDIVSLPVQRATHVLYGDIDSLPVQRATHVLYGDIVS